MPDNLFTAMALTDTLNVGPLYPWDILYYYMYAYNKVSLYFSQPIEMPGLFTTLTFLRGEYVHVTLTMRDQTYEGLRMIL